MAADTIPARLFENEKRRPHRPAYFIKKSGTWRATTWSDYAAEVRQAGKALMALGLGKGSTVAILGFNRPEWTIADVACMCIGGAPAGIYTTCSPSEVAYIVNHAESPVVFVENESQWKKIEEERGNLPKLEHVVTFKGAEPIADDMVMTWDEFMTKGEGVSDEDFFGAVHGLEPDALATFIYTSGTTGPPKGVMLSHENLAWTATTMMSLADGNDRDVGLSYLPLSHIAEQLATVHGPITTGAAVYYAESIEKVADNIKEVRPTIFFAVPRIWEKFHAGVAGKLADATGAKAKLVEWARTVGIRASKYKQRGQEPPGFLGVQYKVADKLIFSKLKAALGLDRGRAFVSGAAPIAREVIEFFASLDIMIREVYGQSEDTGPTSYNRANMTKFGTVGPAIPGIEVKIAEDGEILVKGPNVFMGYYKEKEATDETLVDGWLHSGDLGAFDSEGFLSITGRKKDIIITSGGKNIAPKNLEAAMKNSELVSEAVVIGDQRKYLTALITLDDEAVAKYCQARNLNKVPPHEMGEIRAEIQKTIDAMNRELAKVETVKKFAILPRNFTVDDGELTPTLKVKRRIVSKNWANEIEALYAD